MRHLPQFVYSAILIQAVVLSGCQAETAPQGASAAASSAAASQKKICQDMMSTGSMGFRYICHTQAEWNQINGYADPDVKRSAMPSTFMPHGNAHGNMEMSQ